MLNKKGFTLIELMLVMSVIAILATIILFGLGKAQAAARDVQRQQIVNSVQLALERYYTDQSPNSYPGNGWANLFANNRLGPYIQGALTDPGCGQACTNCDLKTTAAPTPCTAAVTYSYTTNVSGKCVGSGYQVGLLKEGGGNTVYFCGPQ
ncbi:hypothetical protein A2872_01305 [Candidatus Gottesmanbacteria bacterium RIFCSPHIGHO2_01_FULL_42_12]|uniref:Type II secretion system protein GspG C-terminal domain-containing protein n=1 Tax=Candidatus Gottesmanbacteria bacterium RIFCSPHIGHO2_01_FULL_42_12 TaxID=1798377 RepID=A0A1F5Z1R5_9BACT|nr:MAG: hypothetical protein A2872_01305 [Candidatus Gottesmanbacteria bacterium RIFCSPHIGHO2_01_FULL_42_12]